ncbi:P-loop NTPase family protein [Pseudogemmobacter bohemicus]|uniref:hypothetical protein n=1 Tax=Pseudogemmobacter bohemicus TaxID=2250708 RepID=UPI000DD4C2B1|nr:hypothetical protein [Pseudogemmobacter bohemicus]
MLEEPMADLDAASRDLRAGHLRRPPWGMAVIFLDIGWQGWMEGLLDRHLILNQGRVPRPFTSSTLASTALPERICPVGIAACAAGRIRATPSPSRRLPLAIRARCGCLTGWNSRFPAGYRWPGSTLPARGATDPARVAGMVAQSSDRHLLSVKVLDEVALAARNPGLAGPPALALAVLQQLAIADPADQHPLDLDAGQKRLVALAAGIAYGPRVLLLDEIQRRLIGVEALTSTTILAVTHDPDFSAAIANAWLVYGEDGIRLT